MCSSCSEFIFPYHEQSSSIITFRIVETLSEVERVGFSTIAGAWPVADIHRSHESLRAQHVQSNDQSTGAGQVDGLDCVDWKGGGYQKSYSRCQDVAIIITIIMRIAIVIMIMIIVELHCPAQNVTRNCIPKIGRCKEDVHIFCGVPHERPAAK